jgi:multiple sugar transport system substrate-binding protein
VSGRDGALTRRQFVAAGAAVAAAAPRRAGALAPATISIATFPDLDRAVKGQLARWSTLHPECKVVVRTLQYPDHHPAMTAALATGSGLPDVMALDFRFIAKFAASRGLERLDTAPFNAQDLRSRFARYTYPQATTPDGELVAMPADIGPGTLLYRKDLIERAGLGEEDLTKSWESFIAAGRRLKKETGVYLLADTGDIRDIMIRTNLKDGEGIYFDADGEVLIESDRFRRAFELAKQTRAAGLDGRAVAWTNEWVAGHRQSRIGTQMMGCWITGHLKNWLAPQTTGRWRSTVLPAGGHASYGGSFYAIPKKATHKAWAWELIRFMTADKETQLASLRTLDAFPALLEAQQDPLFDEPIPFLGGQRARLLWRDIAAKVPTIPVHRLDAMATDIVRFEFEEVVAQGKDVTRALADAALLVERRARRLRRR